MAFCIQCGETFSVDTPLCPNCKRPVGLSSIGPALERAPRKGNVRLLKVVSVLALASLVAFLIVRFWPSQALPSSAEMERVAARAAPSLVRVAGADGRETGGVVFRRLGKRLVVFAPATVAPVGRVVTVGTLGGKSVPGVSLLSGGAPGIEQLAIVLVPDAQELEVSEARLATSPAADQALVTLTSSAQAASAGLVLSFEDGDGPGVLVHDASLSVAEPGYGFWSTDGRLFALPTFSASRGESLALAVSALSARLLLHELPLLDDGGLSEHALPLVKGTLVAVAAETERLEVRVGGGQARRARDATPGWKAIDAVVSQQGPLQVSARKPKGAAFAVTLAPL